MALINRFPQGGGIGGGSGFPEFTYTGQYQLVDDENGDWRIKFLTSGTFTLLSPEILNIDVFLVGGGGGGGAAGYSSSKSSAGYSYWYNGGGGGGGGYTKTENFLIRSAENYPISIGSGGNGGSDSIDGTQGGETQAFNFSVLGGMPGQKNDTGAQTAPGTGGNVGGTPSARHVSRGTVTLDQQSTDGGSNGVGGQGSTTKEFGEESGLDYAGGGGGGEGANINHPASSGGANGGAPGQNGSTLSGCGGRTAILGNTDCGGGGGNYGGGGGGGGLVGLTDKQNNYGGAGGQGIVIIRNHREVSA